MVGKCDLMIVHLRTIPDLMSNQHSPNRYYELYQYDPQSLNHPSQSSPWNYYYYCHHPSNHHAHLLGIQVRLLMMFILTMRPKIIRRKQRLVTNHCNDDVRDKSGCRTPECTGTNIHASVQLRTASTNDFSSSSSSCHGMNAITIQFQRPKMRGDVPWITAFTKHINKASRDGQKYQYCKNEIPTVIPGIVPIISRGCVGIVEETNRCCTTIVIVEHDFNMMCWYVLSPTTMHVCCRC